MTSAPRTRPQLHVIEGGRSRDAQAIKTTLPPPDPPSAEVIDLACARARAGAEAKAEVRQEITACAPKLQSRLGAAAIGTFLVGLGLWTIWFAGTYEVPVLP